MQTSDVFIQITLWNAENDTFQKGMKDRKPLKKRKKEKKERKRKKDGKISKVGAFHWFGIKLEMGVELWQVQYYEQN